MSDRGVMERLERQRRIEAFLVSFFSDGTRREVFESNGHLLLSVGIRMVSLTRLAEELERDLP